MGKKTLSKKDPLTYLVSLKFPHFYREDSLYDHAYKFKTEDDQAKAYLEELKELPLKSLKPYMTKQFLL